VIAANLTHGDSARPVPERAELAAALYSALAPVPLTGAEQLGALAERDRGDHGPETEYLISLGTAGLEGYL